MSHFNVIGGDFYHGIGIANNIALSLPTGSKPDELELFRKPDIASVSMANEESVKKIGGAVALGTAGGLLLGPVGLIAGALLGGKKKTTITFIITLKDGRQALGQCDSNYYNKVLALCI